MRSAQVVFMIALVTSTTFAERAIGILIPIVDAVQLNGSPWMPVENLYNGHGFDNNGTGDTYDPGISFSDTQWRVHYSERNSNVQLLFDLGSVQPVGNVSIWNYYEGGAGTDGRSTKHLTPSYSTDNVSYTPLPIATLQQQPSTGYDTSSLHTTIPLNVTAEYIKFTFMGDAGDINYGDTNWWGLNEVRFFSPATADLKGDYNGNGVVDAADYVVWRDALNTTTTLPNDPIGGTIGQGQYDQWRGNFGAGGGSGAGASLSSGAVPEPNSLLLVLGCLLGGASIRRRSAATQF